MTRSAVDDAGERLLRGLTAGGPILTPTAIVACHPDDETIGAGGSMTRFLDLTLIHLTNGTLPDAAGRGGPGALDSRASTRQAELDAALTAACVRPVRRVCYDIPDRQVAARYDEVLHRLAADLMTVDAVITHPYEDGHEDHDACARAVHAAAAILRDLTGRAPALLEFAGYYRQHGEVRAGVFWPDPARPEVTLRLSPAGIRRREAAFACFVSQSFNLRYFSLREERFRHAPSYEFSRPPPPAGG
jgi:N-acetylglucosamine malate deacetylase 2